MCRGFMLTQWGRWYDWEVNGTAHASTHFTGVQGDTGVTSCTGGVMVLVGIDAFPYKLMGITAAAPRAQARSKPAVFFAVSQEAFIVLD